MPLSEREKREKDTAKFRKERRERGEVVHVPDEFTTTVPSLNEDDVDVETSLGLVYVDTHGPTKFDAEGVVTLIQALEAAHLRVA